MFQNKLLDKIKCFLVLDMLTDLDNSTPSVRCELFLTVIALHVDFNEFCNEGLLYFSVVVQLFLDGYFHFDSFGVALCPDESCVDYLGLVESFDLLQQ